MTRISKQHPLSSSPNSDKKAVSSLRASSSSQPFLNLSKKASLNVSSLVCLCWHIIRPLDSFLLSYKLSSILSPYPDRYLKESKPLSYFPIIESKLLSSQGKDEWGGASYLPLRLIRRGFPTFTVTLWGSLLQLNS